MQTITKLIDEKTVEQFNQALQPPFEAGAKRRTHQELLGTK